MVHTFIGRTLRTVVLVVVAVPQILAAQAQAPPAPAPPPPVAPAGEPVKVVDLTTAEGSALFGAQWKNMDAKIVEGPAMPNAGPAWTTSYDVVPHAGEAGYDDSSWPTIEAKGLSARRGGGKLFMTWFRTTFTMPAKVGDLDVAGMKAVLSVTVDDYAEVWMNGQLPRAVGKPSPQTIAGFNTPNRVLLTGALKPGDKMQIAIFGINGPISVAPQNPVFVRAATIEFYR
jgi:hypothetical protein